jgi:peptide/nickel transport system substrate-binding protein
MFKKFLLLATGALLLFACQDDKENDDDAIIAKGGVRYGGEFRFMSSEKVTNLFPLMTTDVYANRVASQIFEGLLKIDVASTEVVPSIAKSFKISDDSKVFTFELRDDVYFQDDECFKEGKGRKVTADDFKYSLEYACSKDSLNNLSWLLKGKVKGAEAYFKGEVDEVVGITVESPTQLKIELATPFSGFQKVLTHTGLSVFPKEAVEKYGEKIGSHPVGTGPFKLKSLEEDKITLSRNHNYWDTDDFGNELPFLDQITMTYSKDKTDELLSFRAEKIDLVLDIPVEEVENVLGTLREAQAGENVKHKVDSKSSMSIGYYGFAHESEVFSKKEVRQAFNISIDREAIIETWLEGEGWAAKHGFVPKMKGYPSSSINGHKYNPAKAKALLAKAGYSNGKGFPSIDLYVNGLEGSGTHKLAKAVAFSLKQNLNVTINVKLCSIGERDEALRNGEAIFWRTGWVADYPDPENFLNLFYGGNMNSDDVTVNPFKYNNPEFDKLFEKANAETNDEKRMELLAQCDQMIIDDAVVMPLITDDFVTMVNLKVRKFTTNEMEQLDFSRIFIKEIKE